MKRPVYDAILARRSIHHFRPDPVAEADLLHVIEAATWAPNHHLTEPWRFTLIGPRTRAALIDRYAALQAGDRPGDADAAVIEAARRKLAGKPALVLVSMMRDPDTRRRAEDFAAVCCAIQNLQLAAWEVGLGVQWSTGALVRDPVALAACGLDTDVEEVVALLYLGYAERVPRSRRRPPEAFIRRTE